MTEETFEPLKITAEEGQLAMMAHARERGYHLKLKYGELDEIKMAQVLRDKDFVRYPTRIVYDSTQVDAGLFAAAIRNADSSDKGYTIYIHEYFKDKSEFVPHIALYHLVAVNYGDFASSEAAEEFASSALDMKKEEYYQKLCTLADMLN